MTALIEYLIVLLEYIDLLGAHKQSGAQGKMPQLPPPLGGPVHYQTVSIIQQAASLHTAAIVRDAHKTVACKGVKETLTEIHVVYVLRETMHVLDKILLGCVTCLKSEG